MAKEFQVSDSFKKIFNQANKLHFNQHREINLVPDIKNEMIKALKLRNLIFFICIVVAAASVGVTVFFGVIAGGQQLAIDSKKSAIKTLENKLDSYSDLNDFLTIKDQLSNISEITSNKKVLSRTFNILSALLPTGADTIKISEMNVNLSDTNPTLVFEAQANAGRPPYIDYNVLDSFKKSMKYMHYDYGNYVDKEGAIIPAYCMIETNSQGTFFTESGTSEAESIYAYWTIEGEGCNPSARTVEESENGETENGETENTQSGGYEMESYEGQPVVRIWRTPQYNDWYKENPVEGEPYMSLDGEISNVPHFESSCIKYRGETSDDGTVKWTSSSDENCRLVPDDDGGIIISESSNGRDASEDLVLRFSATITLAPEVYDFNNTHMLALPPSGRYNVTDSYVQVQAMFSKRAKDCAKDDTACKTNGGS